MKSIWKYVIILSSIAVVAILGSLFVNLGIDWFSTLDKPSMFVSGVIISIVWTVIYITFAIILSIWASRVNLPRSTTILLILNGFMNVLWCLLFFTLNNTILGLIAIVLNLVFAILLSIDIYKRVPVFAYITSIYPFWLCLATSLNLALWILN